MTREEKKQVRIRNAEKKGLRRDKHRNAKTRRSKDSTWAKKNSATHFGNKLHTVQGTDLPPMIPGLISAYPAFPVTGTKDIQAVTAGISMQPWIRHQENISLPLNRQGEISESSGSVLSERDHTLS